MTNTKWQWLAEVRIPAGDKGFYVCTGVPISQRYVLTTPHDIPSLTGVQVRFIYDVHHNKGRWRDATVVWNGQQDKLDAMLLEINEVKELISFVYTSSLPAKTADWDGAGFPAMNRIEEGDWEGHLNSTGLTGQFLPGGAQVTGELELTIKGGLDVAEQWAGISGSPVVWNEKLIGIICSVDEAFGAKRLRAVPLYRLLEIPGFNEKLGLQERLALLNSARSELVQSLETRSDVIDALHEQQHVRDVPKSAKPILDCLLGLPIEVFANTIYRAMRNRHIGKPADVDALDTLLNRVLPHLMEHALVSSVSQTIRSGYLVELPLATRTVAEILMASADGRPSSFRRPVSGNNAPVGARLLEDPPEMGIAVSVDEKVREFIDMLRALFLSEEDLRQNFSEAVYCDLINDELKFRAEDSDYGKNRYYYICDNLQEDPLLLQVITRLQQLLDQLIFITLQTQNPDLYREEQHPIRPLREIYKNNPGDDRK